MRSEEPAKASSQVNTVHCFECHSSSGLRGSGWRAYRIDDLEPGAPSALVFFCPTCAEKEFGYSRRV